MDLTHATERELSAISPELLTMVKIMTPAEARAIVCQVEREAWEEAKLQSDAEVIATMTNCIRLPWERPVPGSVEVEWYGQREDAAYFAVIIYERMMGR